MANKAGTTSVYNVKAFGAQGDVITLTDCSITSGSNQVTSAGTTFTTADVNKAIQVRGAGALTTKGTGNTSGTGNQITTVTAWWIPGMYITGTGIPASTQVVAIRGIAGAQTLTLSNNLNGSGGIGTTLSIIASLNGWIGSITSGKANIVTTKGGGTAANATTTGTGLTTRYGTDDTTAISNAYTAAGSAGGGDVYFPQGNFFLNSVTMTFSNVGFQGTPSANIYQLPGTATQMLVKPSASTGPMTDVHFVGLNMHGDPTLTATLPQSVGIYVSGPGNERIKVDRCKFYKFLGTATNQYYVHDLQITNNFAQYCCFPNGWNVFNWQESLDIPPNTGFPANWPGSGHVVVSNNIIEDTPTSAINIGGVGTATSVRTAPRMKVTITGNTIRNASWCAITLETNGGSRNAVVSNNSILDAAGGILHLNTDTTHYTPGYADMNSVVISGNVIDTGDLTGNYFGINAQGSNTVIANNSVRTGGGPISVWAGGGSEFAHNSTITGNICVCTQPSFGVNVAYITANFIDGGQISDNFCTTESYLAMLTITGATAGTFTLSVNDAVTSTTYGPTAGIAFNATPAQVVSALQAVLPSNTDVYVTSGTQTTKNLPTAVLQIHFGSGKMGGRNLTASADFSGLTGGTNSLTPVLGAVSFHGISLNSAHRMHVKDNVVMFAGNNGISATDCKEIRIRDNSIVEPNMRVNTNGTGGAGNGIFIQGNLGLGAIIEGNVCIDRRATVQMNYGLCCLAGTSTGTPIQARYNTFIGFKTGDIFGRSLITLERGTVVDTTSGAVKNQGGLRELYGTAAPTSGAWVVGERVWNSTPTATTTAGWICTTAGSPGTWSQIPFANNAGNSDLTNGMQSIQAPSIFGLVTASVAATANNVYFARFTPGRNMAITNIGFACSSAANKASNGTGDISSGSNQVLNATGTWVVGDGISGTGIPAGTTVTAIASTTLTISANATATTTTLALSEQPFNDQVDVGIYDTSLNRLGSSGPTSGKLIVAGQKTVNLTSTVNLVAGTSYWAAIALGPATSTMASLQWGSLSTSFNPQGIWLAKLHPVNPYGQVASTWATAPGLPSTVGSPSNSAGYGAWLTVREA